ncbi:MAG: 4-alpha-glucanotransferase [Planctomycetota bacterium]
MTIANITDTQSLAPLDRLAEICGIEANYADVEGKIHTISAETKLRILAAMGLDVADERAIESTLQLELNKEWLSLVTKTTVSRGGDCAKLIFYVRIDLIEQLHGRVFARLRAENGGITPLDFTNARESRSRRIGGINIIQIEVDAPPLAPGIYDIECFECGRFPRTEAGRLFVAPEYCYLPPSVLAGKRLLGFSVQLYSLVDESGFGAGTYRGAGELASQLSLKFGADLLGLSPVHITPNRDPHDVSPYCPISRVWRNPVYLNIINLQPVRESPRAQQLLQQKETLQTIAALRSAAAVPYETSARLKLQILRETYADFIELQISAPSDTGREFQQFVERGGEDLHKFATFMSLRDHYISQDPALAYWKHWPAGHADSNSSEVREFQQKQSYQIGFHCFVQWLCERELLEAQALARASGMEAGFYHDLAVGSSGGGAEAWAEPEVFISDAEAGAPPDVFQKNGQSWGVLPLNPRALREKCYEPFIKLVRSAMLCGGAVRLDHVMGLWRLWWVPRGRPATEGAYVKYPIDDLLAIIALESYRSRALVVGEDLGTVAPGVRERMERERILGCRLALFERTDGAGFQPPKNYSYLSVASFGTHDLPTLAGWWLGLDLTIRSRLKQFRSAREEAESIERRAGERSGLLREMQQSGIDITEIESLPFDDPRAVSLFINIFHAWLARANSAIVLISLDDALGETAQRNVPGTLSEYPNWRGKLTKAPETVNITLPAIQNRGRAPANAVLNNKASVL